MSVRSLEVISQKIGTNKLKTFAENKRNIDTSKSEKGSVKRQEFNTYKCLISKRYAKHLQNYDMSQLTFWRRNYFFLILTHLYIKCE